MELWAYYRFRYCLKRTGIRPLVYIELQICLAHATRRPPSNMYMNLLLIPADDQHSCHYDQHRTSNSR